MNRGLDFGFVAPMGSVTIPGTTPPDSRSAWLTLEFGAGSRNCRGTLLITVPASMSGTTAPPTATIATTPFVATMVNPDGSTVNVPIGTSTSFPFEGTHQLYVGTTGVFDAARAGAYAGVFTVSLSKAGGRC